MLILSTNIYLVEIFFLHFLHLPFNNKNEIIGILSFQVINFLHFGQKDLPDTTPLPNGKRYIHTFAKLPQRAPRTNTNMKSTDYDYNFIFDVIWINPSISYWTIKTASSR